MIYYKKANSNSEPIKPTEVSAKVPVANTSVIAKMAKPKPAPPPPPPPVEEVKKRGRPSKEEMERRAKEKLDQENQIKDQLKNAAITPGKEIKVNDKVIDASIPVFKEGDFVKDMVGISKFVHKGIVVRQDIGSQFVCVSWKDGSRQWHSAKMLQLITLKEFKKREKNEPPKPEPLTEEELIVADTMTEISGGMPGSQIRAELIEEEENEE